MTQLDSTPEMTHHDPVLAGFLQRTYEVAPEIDRESTTVSLMPDHRTGTPPRVYFGVFRDIEYFERKGDGSIGVSNAPLGFQLQFPDAYLRSVDRNLQFMVACVDERVYHSNVQGGVVCLGDRFRPGTRLRPLVEHLYRIVTCRVMALDHPFDPAAADFLRANLEKVRALESAPLWTERPPARTRVELIDPQENPVREDPNPMKTAGII